MASCFESTFVMFLKSLVLSLLVSSTGAFYQAGPVHRNPSTEAHATSRLPVDVENASQQPEIDCNGRRTFMIGGAAFLAATLLPTVPVHADTGVDYKAVAKDIMALVEANPDWGPSEFIACFRCLSVPMSPRS
jgi:hypothetical protein